MSMEQDNPIKAEKRRKLHALKEKGINPFPYSFDRTGEAAKVKADFDSLKPGEKSENSLFRLAGRIMTLRSMGKAVFFNLQDMSGQIQVYIRLDDMNEQERTTFDLTDLGDIVGVEGFPFRTQKGELSLWVKSYTMLTKTLEPLPEKFHGIQDVEIKYRHRHMDLATDIESRKVFEMRTKVLKFIRRFLDDRGFLEVETPILQPIYGGAAAHPFTSHHRALDMKLYMRISPELYLKRLIVGGFDKVYDMGKMFRNEGIDRTHVGDTQEAQHPGQTPFFTAAFRTHADHKNRGLRINPPQGQTTGDAETIRIQNTGTSAARQSEVFPTRVDRPRHMADAEVHRRLHVDNDRPFRE